MNSSFLAVFDQAFHDRSSCTSYEDVKRSLAYWESAGYRCRYWFRTQSSISDFRIRALYASIIANPTASLNTRLESYSALPSDRLKGDYPVTRNLLETHACYRQVLVVIIALTWAGSALAQESTEELAKAVQNPIADLISLPFQNNTTFDYGPDDKTQNTLNIQPVWPVTLNQNWNVITRTIVPVVSNPSLIPGGSRETGLGDTTFTAFFSPSKAGKWLWGAGPVLLLPTSTDDQLGADEWGIGPSLVVLTMPGSWVIGSLWSNVWGINEDTGNDVNVFTWQYFVNYNMEGGWYLTTAPIMTANWEAPSGQKWTIPVGGGFGRVFRVGKQPLNFNIQGFYNVESPDFVGDWSMRFQLQLMFPKK